MAAQKTCNTCGIRKPLNSFARNPRSRDGHRHKCKDCTASTSPAAAEDELAAVVLPLWTPDSPVTWARDAAQHILDAMASTPGDRNKQAFARAAKGMLDTIVSAGRQSDLEARVAALVDLVDAWKTESEHGTEFVGVDQINIRNAAAVEGIKH